VASPVSVNHRNSGEGELLEVDSIAGRVQRAGGLRLLAWKLARLASTLTLVGLSAATLAERDYNAINLSAVNSSAFALEWQGGSWFQWTARMHPVEPVVENFWIDVVLLIIFVSCTGQCTLVKLTNELVRSILQS